MDYDQLVHSNHHRLSSDDPFHYNPHHYVRGNLSVEVQTLSRSGTSADVVDDAVDGKDEYDDYDAVVEVDRNDDNVDHTM